MYNHYFIKAVNLKYHFKEGIPYKFSQEQLTELKPLYLQFQINI